MSEINGDHIKKFFHHFLSYYKRDKDIPIYLEYFEKIMIPEETTTMEINFEHVEDFNSDLASSIRNYYYQCEKYLREALLNFVKENNDSYAVIGHSGEDKQFYISFFNFKTHFTIRQIRSSNIGSLLSITGTVTRSSDVRPELILGTFKCKNCGTKIPNVTQNFQYTEPSSCPNSSCNNHSKFDLITDQSVFVDWQRLLVQENPLEVPSGSMPRTIEVILRNDLVEKAKPGDRCTIVGTPVTVPDTAKRLIGERATVQKLAGFAADGVVGVKGYGVRELTYKLSFLASSVSTSDVEVKKPTEDEKKILENMRMDRDLYTRLAKSIAPHIYAHEEVKRGILLMLIGGCQKETQESIKLRGDINICIVGDPSTAKSQFLKFVSNLLPRSVYTSGQSSSAAGLTASVSKDSETGDFTIEAGALMLADSGVCCIDEFDKMNDKDQVAIHEAMEQQTISLSKAGIHASLYARTSVLAAANPRGGRYDRAKSLRSNLNISAPIMSRFDLFFVIVDECKPELDRSIAKHILTVHRDKNKNQEEEYYNSDILLKYIRYAKAHSPTISDEAAKQLVKAYTELRNDDSTGFSRSSYRITVRQLEALIRLSEALAKMRWDRYVTSQHVQEATRLLRQSIIQIESEAISFERPEAEEYEEPSARVKTISFEAYSRIAKLIIYKLESEKEAGNEGMTLPDITDWWLNSHQDNYGAADDISTDIRIIELTLKRLINRDHVLEEDPDTKLITVSPNLLK